MAVKRSTLRPVFGKYQIIGRILAALSLPLVVFIWAAAELWEIRSQLKAALKECWDVAFGRWY